MLNRFTIVSDETNEIWLIETDLNEVEFGSRLQRFQVNDLKDNSKITLEEFVKSLQLDGFIIRLTKLDNIFSWWAN